MALSKESVVFRIPLVYVKNKKLMTLNTSNQMQFHQRRVIKDRFKESINPIISELDRFSSGHVHLIFQIHYSDRRYRDNDNNIYVTKWLQDHMVELGLLDDDKHVSFTFLPAVNDPQLDEHYCEVTCIDLQENNYFQKLKANYEKTKTT